MMRKAVIGALAASALAFPALAVRDHVATALVVMNGDQDPSGEAARASATPQPTAAPARRTARRGRGIARLARRF